MSIVWLLLISFQIACQRRNR